MAAAMTWLSRLIDAADLATFRAMHGIESALDDPFVKSKNYPKMGEHLSEAIGHLARARASLALAELERKRRQ